MTQTYNPTEVISFQRGDNLATVATNGLRHVTQEFELVREHRTLRMAISYLEAKGYRVQPGNFEAL
jgi:hypothetical protein